MKILDICFREILGPDLVFIILDMSQEDRRKRVLKRHDGSEGAADLMDVGLNIAKILYFFFQILDLFKAE